MLKRLEAPFQVLNCANRVNPLRISATVTPEMCEPTRYLRVKPYSSPACYGQAAISARLKRLTLILRAGKIEEALYLVFPPNESAEQVLEWLRKHPA